jgi:prolyl oligopeptidase
MTLADPRPTLEAPDDDPWIWLEEVDGPQATSWADTQTAKTLERFGGPAFLKDREDLAAIYDQPANIPFVARRGDKLFNFWKDAEHPRGLWRTTTLESYRTEAPEWELLLDLDALSETEGEDWIWAGPATLPATHDRAMLSLSRGGGDATVLREFDLTTRSFVADGFTLPEAKGGATWLDRDTLLLQSAYGPGMATRSGYAKTVRLWKRGADPLTAPVIYEIPEESMGAGAHVDREAGTETIWFTERIAFFDVRYWIGDRTGPKTQIDVPTDVEVDASREWLAAKPRFPWTVEGRTIAPDSVAVIRLDDFLAGGRDFAILFEPAERRALQGFFMRDGRIAVSILDDLRPVFEIWTPPAGGPGAAGDWSMARITGLPDLGVANIWPLDVEESESNGDMLANAQDPLTPQTLFLIRAGGSPEPLKRGPAAFDPSGLVISRHEAVSVDGTRIPYTQVGPAEATGDAPVHLYAYGGFGISQLPSYNSAIGKLWLERGGTSVVANIRGGGEFGTAWHEAGRREGKRLSHDDFAAVAADLVRRGVTRAERIAAEGGSNGGILISNMLTRYPERFGALFCTIPLIDMRRYTKLLAGASWMAEYGDPDDPADWAFLGPMSAYHTAVPGQDYPPILIATTRRDDRVHPGHARKMAAKLQAMGYEAYFYEPAAGGHGYGKDNTERAGFTALGYSFLRRAIGWEEA